MSAASARQGFVSELRRIVVIMAGFIALLWIILAVNALFFSGALLSWGIVPRDMAGLRGIVFAPLLHGDTAHLVGNTGGLLMLGGLVLAREEKHFWVVTALGALIGGFGTWLVGRPPVHVGASSVVFAYFGYLATTGWFERRFGSILLSIGALVVWGGLIFGVLPTQSHISWEGHFFGMAGGVLAARTLARRRSPR